MGGRPGKKKAASAGSPLPVKNFNAKQDLLLKYGAMFPRWACSLAEGFNLLLYGFGSKRPLLSAFAKFLMEVDSEAAVVEVLGYSPHFSLKELLVQISVAAGLSSEEDSVNVTGSRKSVSALAKKVLGDLRKSQGERTVVLLVSNIEGANLRGEDCQNVLARLAALPNVHLVATGDNVSVLPLLWDQKQSAQFNFHYSHVPTYCSYEDELMYQDDIAFEENDGRRLQAASVVLSSLTQTARAVFHQLAEAQLSDHPTGLAFGSLFTACRERLILSNEITLRSHLEEFIDHDIVAMSDDGLYKCTLSSASLDVIMNNL